MDVLCLHLCRDLLQITILILLHLPREPLSASMRQPLTASVLYPKTLTHLTPPCMLPITPSGEQPSSRSKKSQVTPEMVNCRFHKAHFYDGGEEEKRTRPVFDQGKNEKGKKI